MVGYFEVDPDRDETEFIRYDLVRLGEICCDHSMRYAATVENDDDIMHVYVERRSTCGKEAGGPYAT
jgi:hypothetical protein